MEGERSKEGVHPSAGRYFRGRGRGGMTVGPDGASVCRGGASRFNRSRWSDSFVNYRGVGRGGTSRARANRWDGTWRGDAVGYGGVPGQGDTVGHGGFTWRGDIAGRSRVGHGGVTGQEDTVSRGGVGHGGVTGREDTVSSGGVGYGGVTWRGDTAGSGGVGHGGVTWRGHTAGCGGVASWQEVAAYRHPEGVGSLPRSQTWQGQAVGRTGARAPTAGQGDAPRHVEGGFQNWRDHASHPEKGAFRSGQWWGDDAVYSGYSEDGSLRMAVSGHRGVRAGDDAIQTGYSEDDSLRSRGDQTVQDVESISRHRGVRAGDSAVQPNIGLGAVEGAASTDAYSNSGADTNREEMNNFYGGSIKVNEETNPVNEETNPIRKESPRSPICAAPYSPPHIDSHWRARNSPVPDANQKAYEEYIKRKKVLEGLYGWETTYILLKLIKESPEAALLFDQKVKELKAKMNRILTVYEAYPTLSEQVISEEFKRRHSAMILDVTTVPRRNKYNKALVEFKTEKDIDDFLKKEKLKKITDFGEFKCVQLQNKCSCKVYPVNSTTDYECLSDELRVTIKGSKSVSGEDIYQFFMREFDGDVALGPTDLSKLDGKLMGYSHLYFCRKKTVDEVLSRKVFYVGVNQNKITVFRDDASADEERRARRESVLNASDLSRTSSGSSRQKTTGTSDSEKFSYGSVPQEVLNFDEEGGQMETPEFYLDDMHAGALTRAALPNPHKSARKRPRHSA